ncbi:MAG: GDYXXLXY domain-containing protein [Patescibacteria group bacterium]|nr:GDYXXLXY domain-containing protein [Patescibacteria group bacterium]
MPKFQNKGISTSLAILIVLTVAILVGDILVYKFLWTPKEEKLPKIETSEVKVSEEKILLKVLTFDPSILYYKNINKLLLLYKISFLQFATYPGLSDFKSGENIYLTLRKEDNYWTADKVFHSKPREGIFIKGKVLSTLKTGLAVKYSIETYLLPEEKIAEIEEKALEFEEIEREKKLFAEVNINNSGESSIEKFFIDQNEINLSKTEKGKGEEVLEFMTSFLKMMDSRIISSIAQTKTVMAYISHENSNYDNFNCLHSDMKILCQEVEQSGGIMNISKDKKVNSQKACVFSPLYIGPNPLKFYWYCAESSGKAGFTSIDPSMPGYCVDGVSANCPPFED